MPTKKDNGPINEAKLRDEAAAAAAEEAKLEAEVALAKADQSEEEEASREQVKADLFAKFKAEAKEAALADEVAKLKAKLQAEEDERIKKEAEAEGKTEAKAEAKKDKPDNTWKDDPDAEIERVFRGDHFRAGVPFRENIMVRQRLASQVNGTTVEPFSKKLMPTPSNQYILLKGAVDYPKQLESLRKHEADGNIIEIDPKFKGSPYIHPTMIAIREHEKILAELKAQ